MALVDRAKQGPPPPKKPGFLCGIARILAELPDDEAAALQVMLVKDSGWTHPAIAEALSDEGYPATRTVVNHHRVGRCGCNR